MRKLLFLIILFVAAISFVLSSNNFGVVYTFTGDSIHVISEDTAVYTPNGGRVPALFLSEGMTATRIVNDWNAILMQYPDVEFVGNATTTYNCHSYAWNMTEDDGLTCWINSPTEYWYDYSYLETTSEHAQKIVYGTGSVHSAVRSVGGKYISKWGPSFLVKHNPTDTPYGSYMKYYAKPPEISGHPIVSNIVSSTFTLDFAPKNMSIQWVYDTNLFTAVGPTTGSSVTIKAKSASAVGVGTLTAQFKKSGSVKATSTYTIYANRLPAQSTPSLRVVRSSDGVEVYPSSTDLCPNTFYYAYLSGTSGSYSYNWDMNHATVYSSSSSQAYFKTDDQGWTFLDIYAVDTPTGVSQNIYGVTLYGGSSCD